MYVCIYVYTYIYICIQGLVIFLMSFFFPLQVNNVCFSLQTGGMTDDAVEELQGLTKKKFTKTKLTGGMTDDAVEELQGLTRMRTLNISQNEFVGNPAGKIFFY